jgi:hypothetical protein
MAFENYWEEKKAYDSTNKVEMVKVIPSNSPAFNRSILLGSIYDMNNMNDSELRMFVQNSFKSILNNIFFGSAESVDYINCFTNVRFLDAFIDVVQRFIQQGNYFDRDDIAKINNICYDYITFNSTNKNQAVVNRMYMLANIINAPFIPRLLGLGLSNNVASLLIIARRSNLDPKVCVRRVNFIIIGRPKSLMTQENIVQIMKILYELDRDQRNFISIFPHIMMDVLGDYDDAIPSTHWITDEIQEVDSILSLAALDILNEFSDVNIRHTLINYTESYNLLFSKEPIRFSMRKLSEDYQKINNVVYNLQEYENIIVP